LRIFKLMTLKIGACNTLNNSLLFFRRPWALLKNIGMWWGHIASCVLIVIIALWWGHIALSSYIICTSSQCSAWIAPILFFYSNLQNVFAHYVLVIFENFGLFSYFFMEILENSRIGVLCGTSFGGFQ
jgi:hypothetical protein